MELIEEHPNYIDNGDEIELARYFLWAVQLNRITISLIASIMLVNIRMTSPVLADESYRAFVASETGSRRDKKF